MHTHPRPEAGEQNYLSAHQSGPGHLGDGMLGDWVLCSTRQFPGCCSAGTWRGPVRETSTYRRAKWRPHSQLGLKKKVGGRKGECEWGAHCWYLERVGPEAGRNSHSIPFLLFAVLLGSRVLCLVTMRWDVQLRFAHWGVRGRFV